jgi:hypothetical protein
LPWDQVVKIKVHVFKNFKFEIPAEMYRLVLAGTIASLLTIAVIYSRDRDVAATEVMPNGSKQTFQQPKDREQAEGRFTPTPKVAEASKDKGVEIAEVLRRRRSNLEAD